MALSFHHVGIACHDLMLEMQRLTPLGYRQEGVSFVDQTQGVEGIFMNGGGPRLEILRPLHEHGVLFPWLKAGKKLYHLAYTVGGELEQELSELRSQGAKLVVAPVPATAFHGAEICFLMLPNMLLVELIAADIACEHS
jgi:methylmalonyl-CoA/ethylmalonyl-CoA epimerase